jgi:hypothetical protein
MLDHELRALVSVDPSPDFQARVRSRVGAEPARVGWLSVPAAALGAAAVVVVVAVVALTFVFTPGVPNPRATGGNHVMVANAVGPHAPLAGTVPVERPGRAPVSPAHRTQAVSFSRVQLDRDETLALQRLFASSWTRMVTDAAEPVHGPIVIPEIVIEPLVVDGLTEGASR